MKQEKNLQEVYFKLAEQWYKTTIDLKRVYSSVHSRENKYGSSANQLVNEMFVNLLELAFQKKICLTRLVITDYGCGQSKASNVLAQVIAQNAVQITDMLYTRNYGEILQVMAPAIKAADEQQNSALPRIASYGHVVVQRYDIGIPEYAQKPSMKADVVYCNDVFEHIPEKDIVPFIEGLEDAGKYIMASISLRDAVNYMSVPLTMLQEHAVPVDIPLEGEGIVLSQDISGDFIFSLHVSVFSRDKWQQILGPSWFLLDAQDYTACSAMSFMPSVGFREYKKNLISQVGFADFIPFPTVLGSRYEKDPILWRRTALMQPEKHIRKLNVLTDYPNSDFKSREMQESLDFLAYIGAKINNDNGIWQLVELPQDFLCELSELERKSKLGQTTDAQVRAMAQKIIEEKL